MRGLGFEGTVEAQASRGESVEVRGPRNLSRKSYGGNDSSNQKGHGDGDEDMHDEVIMNTR